MEARSAVTFTTLWVSPEIQRVLLSEPPSAEEISTRNALNVPAGTLTSSLPATISCNNFTFCVCTSKLKLLQLMVAGKEDVRVPDPNRPHLQTMGRPSQPRS